MAENPYGLHDLPAVGGGAPGLPRRRAEATPPRGEVTFALPGTYAWKVPKGVTSICAVCVGAGGRPASSLGAGAGGGLAWKNDIPVTPGDLITIRVAAVDEGHGSETYVMDASIVCATSAGNTTQIGLFAAGDGGGNGGVGGSGGVVSNNNMGGGGAGGYEGNGGNGTGPSVARGNGSGGGGAGGVSGVSGGGVGLFGIGASGVGSGAGGSGGLHGTTVWPGQFGGGMRWNTTNTGPFAGGMAAVRIVWGKGRAFPSTDVGPT